MAKEENGQRVVVAEPHLARVEPLPRPEIPEGHCLLRVLRAAVGPSDLHVYRGDYRRQEYPRIPGAEVLAEVGACEGGISPVRRVVVPQTVPCGTCTACREGDPGRCLSPGLLGRDTDGGMRTWMTVPADLPVEVPDDLDDDHAVCIPDTAFALRLLRRLRHTVTPGGYVVVFGAGFLGVTLCLAAIEQGLQPILADVVQARLELARSFGVEHVCNPLRDFIGNQVHWITRRSYAEASVVVSEDPEAVLTAATVLRPGGFLFLSGLHSDSRLPVADLIDHSITVVGLRRSAKITKEAAAFIVRNRAVYASLISLRLEPDSMPQALELLANDPKSYMKVICSL